MVGQIINLLILHLFLTNVIISYRITGKIYFPDNYFVTCVKHRRISRKLDVLDIFLITSEIVLIENLVRPCT